MVSLLKTVSSQAGDVTAVRAQFLIPGGGEAINRPWGLEPGRGEGAEGASEIREAGSSSE